MSLDQPIVWFSKTTAMSQSIIRFPVIGQITGQQAVIIFGLGLPVLFGIMQTTGSIATAVPPFLAIIVFAMIRPPLMSYEARMFARLRFMIFGPKKKSQKKKRTRQVSDVLVVPSSDIDGEITEPIETVPDVPIICHVKPDTQVEVSIKLKSGDVIMVRKKACVFFDGKLQKTTISDSSGQIRLLLDSADCVGTKEIIAREVGNDGKPGEIIVSKKVEFVQQ